MLTLRRSGGGGCDNAHRIAPNCDLAHSPTSHFVLGFAIQHEKKRGRPMWDDRECSEKRASAADIRSNWVIVAALLFGMAAWSNLQLLMTNAMAPIVAEPRDISAR
jgi:hypothetical protein